MSEPVYDGIAIVGISGRFPGAGDIRTFWKNLLEGKETISLLTDEQLRSAGFDPEQLKRDPAFVPARGLLDKPEWFDAGFFGISPREAEVTDPQQRVFLEESWHALEDAGIDPTRYTGAIGVFAGMSNNTYWANNVTTRPDLIEAVGSLTAMMGNEKDYLATRVAYKLNLRGPALNIYTACSTSLVAVCQAVTSLLNFQCDAAIAGGISITFPQERGYTSQEGGITSPDGHCRAFDVDAAGTVFSHGTGVVVLKRLADAIADGDQVYAVIKGAALNNDGASKVSFTAPSVDGHAEVIAMAQALADFSPDSISYVETHGTGTPLGDPIEIAGLTQAFRDGSSGKNFCAIGSVKTNIGHLDAAAGVAGLIKTALALKHRKIPATLHFKRPNPKLELESSPFYVNDRLADWDHGPRPRRAGVSSFGVGGTNAHVVLEEAPEIPPSDPASRPAQLIVLSARSASSLDAAAERLADALSEEPKSLADVAWTLQTGRREFAHRRVVAGRDTTAVIAALRAPKGKRSASAMHDGTVRTPVFMFPGQGAQFASMGLQLAQSEPVFREALEHCARVLAPSLGMDLRDAIRDKSLLVQTRFTQPALFAVSYAMARLWMEWGISPAAMIGHSVGEYVAATLAGVMSVDDALRLVAKRAELVQSLPGGAMVAVRLGEDAARELLTDGLSLAAINSHKLCVLAGEFDAVQKLEENLQAQGVAFRRLATSHAFHSAMMEPVLETFEREVAKVALSEPKIPFVSTVSGDWITAREATDPAYWAAHVRQPVRFAPALGVLLGEEARLLIECGPGSSLGQLARQHPGKTDRHRVLSTMEDPSEELDGVMLALGEAWLAGLTPDWTRVHGGEKRRRVSLPGYPFERQRYWAEPGERVSPALPVSAQADTVADVDAAEPAAPAAEATPQAGETTLKTLLEELGKLSGLSLTEEQADTSFVELGFDSLFLSQAVVALQRRFKIPLTFRRLLEDTPTARSLAAWIEERTDKTVAVRDEPAPAKAARTLRREATVSEPARAHGPFRAIDRSAGTDLTPQQQTALSELIRDYNARTGGSKRFTEKHRDHLADPRAVAGFRRAWKDLVYPLVTNFSEGAYLRDVDGNEYIDITLGFGQILLGHRPKFLVDAVEQQLHTGFEIGPTSPLAGEIAVLLQEIIGCERVGFCNTGSEAVTAALRVARTITGRSRIVVFAGAYHGIFDEVLIRPIADNRAAPIAPGIEPGAVENVIVLEYGSDAALEVIRQQADEIAAVLVEPVQSRRPELQPREFLQELRKITQESGTALVFDEVVTGFRTHLRGAQEWFGIDADLVTYGKVVGGGLPIGIITGKARFMDALDGGTWRFGDDSAPEVSTTFFAGTFVRHPLALAAAKSVLEHLKVAGPSLQKDLTERASRLVGEMNAHLEKRGVPLRWTQFSSMFHLAVPPEMKFASLLWVHLRMRGIHAWEGRPSFISTAHTDADLAKVAQAFRESVDAMIAGGFLPTNSKAALPAGAIPLTDAQQELWVASSLGGDASAAFNESVTIHFRGKVDESALQQALNDLAARHESLRMTFAADGYSQRAKDAAPVALTVKDGGDRLEEIVERETRTPFDLRKGPLIRAVLVRKGEDGSALVLTIHHIVCDGWSFSVLVKELGELYSARRESREPVLPPAPAFREYARWMAELTAKPEHAATEVYWLRQFETVPAPLELPLDRPRPSVRTYRAARAKTIIPADVLEQAKAVSAKQRSTLFTTLLTAFHVLLHRLSGQDDIVVGIAAAGQAAYNDNLVGHCLNFLPIRAEIARDRAFAEIASEMRTRVLDAFEHQHYTFGRLIQKLDLPREASRMPLLSVTFNMDRSALDLAFSGVDAEFEVNPKSRLGLEMSFNLIETPRGMELYAAYNADLFDAATIERWLGHYLELVRGICAAPETPVAKLPLLTDDEKRRLLKEWGENVRPYPSEVTVAALFEEQVQRAPEQIAVVDGERKVSYRELNDLADRYAAQLAENGVKRGDFVALRAERGLRFIAGCLGILKAGGAYVPLAPDDPPERLAKMRGECARELNIDMEPEARGHRPIEGKAAAGDPAYVLYTSGSTGIPKGVVVPHCAIVRLVCNTDYVEFGPGVVMGHASNLCFDAATFEIWGALLNGGSLVITPQDILLSPKRLAEHFAQHGINTVFLTTSLFNQVARQSPAIFKGMRTVVFGGEAADPKACELVLANGAPVRLVNGYGPTETTTFAVAHTVDKVEGERVPIGRPIANTSVYVLDDALEPVPIGVTGELYIGGPGVALGYHLDPALTAERFIETPFGRVYRTGDYVRWRADSLIDYLGRRDKQIKLRGFRIEPGEIEAAMHAVPGISQCAVLVREVQPGDRRLIGYYVTNGTAQPNAADIRAELERRLPPFMVPSSLVALDALPLTRNGKLDERALPLPHPGEGPKCGYRPSENLLHQQLIEIWEELLNRRPIGIGDDFFELGGHSLLAAHMLAEVETRLGRSIALGVLFRHATIEGLAAALLDEQQRSAAKQPLVLLNPEGKKRPFFFLHGDFVGGGFFCHELARKIGEDRPFYVVHPHGLCGDAVPGSVEEMAQSRLDAIRAVQPKGPYLLGGYCNGGFVAYEMARLLKAAGETVEMVVLLNAEASNFRYRSLYHCAEMWTRMAGGNGGETEARFERLRSSVEKGEEKLRFVRAAWSRLREQPLPKQARLILRKAGRSLGVISGPDEPATPVAAAVPEGARARVGDAYENALRTWLPRPYEGKVALLWAEEQPASHGRTPDYGWRDLCADLRFELVPGNHHGSVSEGRHLTVVGAKIWEILESVDPGEVSKG